MTEQEDTKHFDFTQIKIKEEKIDAEIERKLNPAAKPATNGQAEEEDKKKPLAAIKSSNEILAELFSVFNAAPPEELLNDESLIKHAKRKKEKKKKKKRKKSKLDDDASNSDNSEKSHSSSRHKRKKSKKHKSSNHSDRKNNILEVIKTEPEALSPVINRSRSKSPRSRATKDQVEFRIEPKKSSRRDDSRDRDRTKNNRQKEADRIRQKNDSEISLSDEETFLQEKHREGTNAFYDIDRKYINHRERSRSSRNGFYKSYDRNSNDRLRANDRYRRSSRDRFRSRTRSRSPHLNIDKKQLLETARKNVILMFKNGKLPGCVGMTDEIKDKVLLKMRYGGKTVQDLTDFCKKLSNGENMNDLSELSSEEDSDHDRDGNSKAFHHPFVMKEREPIVMHIKNSIPIPPKKADQSVAIQQFPVSSGQDHRLTEEWVPVGPTKPAAIPPTSLTKQISTKPKNVFEKPLPSDHQQPAFKPANTTQSEETITAESISEIALPHPQPPIVTVPIQVEQPPQVSVFTNTESSNVDVSTIITKRLHAMRRLQENPMDSEAIKMMYCSQKEMTSWASSKFTPGQFTGSTGANVLSARELTSGQQAWVRKDQLTATVPLTGGMGMHLLKKMGWKPGEGLGREKNGALQPLLLDVKLDKRGIAANEETPEHKQRMERNKKKKSNATAQDQNKHPVCLLNELAAKRRWAIPVYDLAQNDGPSHQKSFLFKVQLNGICYQPPVMSTNKKEAKSAAARYCLQQIGILPM